MIQLDEATHTYTDPDIGLVYASVTKIIGEAGLRGDAARYYTEYSRERGSKAHKVIELYLKGTLDEATVDPALAGYFQAYKAFEADTGFFPGFIEHILHSVPLRVAGTADLIGPDWKGKGAVIIDLKTSMTPSPATGIQLSGYEELFGVNPELPKPKRFALHLKPDGKPKLIPYTDRNDRAVFLAAVALYHWRKANVKGET